MSARDQFRSYWCLQLINKKTFKEGFFIYLLIFKLLIILFIGCFQEVSKEFHTIKRLTQESEIFISITILLVIGLGLIKNGLALLLSQITPPGLLGYLHIHTHILFFVIRRLLQKSIIVFPKLGVNQLFPSGIPSANSISIVFPARLPISDIGYEMYC